MSLHNNCQCEHAKHFDGTKHAHPYGASFTRVVKVSTTMGDFWCCPECASTCYGPDSGVRK